MKQSILEKMMKVIIIGLGICGTAVFAYIIPQIGRHIINVYPDLSSWYAPWMIFILCAAIPCYAALVLGWRISMRIGNDNSFCLKNSSELKYVAILAFSDSIYFLVGSIILWLCGKNHPSIVLGSFLIAFIGIAIAVASAVLSRLVLNATQIKQENDLTI